MNTKISISRKRFVILRQGISGTEIFCGLARHYSFRSISAVGDVPIKTYLSKKKAIAALTASWNEAYDSERYRVVSVIETIASNEYADNIE